MPPSTVCSVPLRIRLIGEPSVDDLELIEGAVARAVAARIAHGTALLAAPDGRAARTAPELVTGDFDPAAADALGSYAVPSYEDGGRAVRVPVARTSGTPGGVTPTMAALRRIHQLLSTGLFDWSVSDEEARGVLRILQALDPPELFEVVTAMQLTDAWRTFRRNLAAVDDDAVVSLEMRMDPNAGFVMPGDDIRIEVYAGAHREDGMSNDHNVERDGVHVVPLRQPVRVGGLLPADAAGAIARAYVEELILVAPRVRLLVTRRGHYYGRHIGPTAQSVWFEGSAGPEPGSPEERVRQRRALFASYLAAVPVDSPLVVGALHRYYGWIDAHESQPDFFTVEPHELWERSLHETGAPPVQTPIQPFVDLMHSMSARLPAAPPTERARLRDTLGRYMAWIDAHWDDPQIARHDPVDVWVRAYMRTLRGEVQADVAADAEARQRRADQEAADRAARVDWPAAGARYDEVLRMLITQVWRMPDPDYVEDRTAGVGYLMWPTTAERDARDRIATAYLHDVIGRMADPEFAHLDVRADFAAWLRSHPDLYDTYLLAQSHPFVERHGIDIDVPGWQTAVEIGIGFVPVVGQVVGAYEAIGGEDMFGHPLSVTDRAILGAAILLPAAARLGRIGSRAVTTSRLISEYRLTGGEASALWRATLEIRPGSVGARLLGEARSDILAGRSVTDPQRLAEIQGVLGRMGFTSSTTQAELAAGGARAESAVAGEAVEAIERDEGRAGAAGGGGEPPRGTPPEGGGGGGGGRVTPTLHQLQRGAALRTEAAEIERRAAAEVAEATRQEGEAAIAGTPERAERLRARAADARTRADGLNLRSQALRDEAVGYESGAQSAIADLPDFDELDWSTLTRGNMVQIPLAAAERDPDGLARLLRPIEQGRPGTRVVYRVEGGGGRTLIDVAANGDVTIQRGQAIHLNFGSLDRAVEFLGQRGTGARIVRFEVREEWIQSLRSGAIPEFRTPMQQGVPQLVDVLDAHDQLGIPAGLIDELQQFILPGSGVVVTFNP